MKTLLSSKYMYIYDFFSWQYLISVPVHKLLLNVMTHLSKISQNLFLEAEFDHCAEGFSWATGGQILMSCSSRFGRLETSGCLMTKLVLASVTLRRHQWHPKQHSRSFSVGHLPLASLVLLIITKLAVNLDTLWMTYMHSLLFLFMHNSCSSHGIKSWSLTLKFDARMLSSKHCWKHLICSVLIKSNDQSPTFTNSWE